MLSKSKFWVWFIPLFVILCFGIYILVDKASKVPSNSNTTIDALEVSEDAKAIKKEYEEITEPIKVILSENNSYVYTTDELFQEVLNNNGIIFFGEVSSYASRKVISLLDEAVASTSINKIIYIDMATIDDDHMDIYKKALDTKEINAGDTYLVKSKEVLEEIKVKEYDDDKELTEEQKEKLQKKYFDSINYLIEQCDEHC